MRTQEIKSEKILIEKIFSDLWFRIPEYQRPYVWGNDEVNELLEDISQAMLENKDSEYFLGSFVYQSKSADSDNDLLDGQQRMTTIMLLFSVIRDLTNDEEAKEQCQDCLYQKAKRFREIPERPRIVFAIRNDAGKFIADIAKENITLDSISDYETSEHDISVQNMAKAVKFMKEFFEKNTNVKPEDFLGFLLKKVLLISVSTESLKDAFRLFTILNNRGVPLRTSDILKTINLGALPEEEKNKYAKFWEDAENHLGKDFDRFLNHIRTILVKEKAKSTLLEEFEDKIYNSKNKSKSTLLYKGKETFDTVSEYLEIYKKLFDASHHNFSGQKKYDFNNLVKVMNTGLRSTDWIPPLLFYCSRFDNERVYEFLVKLDNKISSDWITQKTAGIRIEAMNTVIKVIENSKTADEVFASDCFDIELDNLKNILTGTMYQKVFDRYILLKLDYLEANHDNPMQFQKLSVEHILPQNPDEDSQWKKDFNESQIAEFKDKIGNLVLITRRKNSSLGRRDYQSKKKTYFEGIIDVFPSSVKVFTENEKWTPFELEKNQEYKIQKIIGHYENPTVK